MTTKEFVRYAGERPELCEKLSACVTPEEVYAIAAAEGLTDTQEEFIAEVSRIKETVQLSEEDLEKVAAAEGRTTLLSLASIGTVTMLVSMTAL